MKKLISVVLLLAMVLGLFAGCGKDKEAAAGLQSAAEYLTSMYQTAAKDEAIVITADQDVLKSVVVDGVSYAIAWSVEVTEGAADSVTVSESTKENHVKLDIPLHSGSNILFTATALISDAEGNSETVTFNYMVEGVKLAGEGMTMEELVEAAYALEEDTALEGLAVLTGVVSMINTPYDAGYKNLTCTMIVGDLTDMPIKCYRLKGEGAETLAVGDTITVSGTLKNYGGTIEFDAGCMIDELIKSDAPAVEAPADPMQIVQDAYALEENASLSYSATLTGTITSVDQPYDAGYQNITVTMVVTGCEDKPIKCYRLKGEGADTLGVGAVITVTGVLMNYNGTVEFAQGCTLDAIVSGGDAAPVAPTDPLAIVDAAYALAPETSLPYIATLTGVITSIDQAYDAAYQNVTVTMTVAGREQKPIKCYRMKGTGADTLAVGDTITVSGTIKNYGGTIEFDTGCALTAVTKGNGPTLTQPATEVEIVDQAYTLASNQALPYQPTLTGKVTYIKDLYSSQYKNISVVIQVPGREFRPLVCYRMTGTDVDKVAVGDTITVKGTIKNYNGTIQFDTGCKMEKRVSGGGKAPVAETDPLKIVDQAYALKDGTEMAYDATLTGRVSSVKDAYDATYKNISVIIQVVGRESKPILAYRLKGDGVDQVAVGDTITVVGRLKNYNGTIEFDAGCTMTKRISGGGTAIKPETEPNKILAAGSSLKDNEELPYTVTLSGRVTSIDEAYNSDYENVTATIAVNGTSQVLKLYRLKGDHAADLAVNDTITVEGKIKKFYGELELVNGKITAWKDGGNDAPVAQTDYKKIVDEAYALAAGAALPYTATLEGRIVELQSPYDSNYKNMTVAIVVVGREDKPIVCYRMKGDNIGNHLCVGDTITVEGSIKNYVDSKGKSTIEFDAGCKMTDRKAGSVSKPTDPKQIVDAAFALEKNAVLPYFATLTGTVKAITEPYTEQYKNVTLTITVEGTTGYKDLVCYRMKGDAAATVAVGNTITVTGAIKNYVGTDKETGAEKPAVVEFDSGCVLESLQKSTSLYIQSEPVVSEIQQSNAAVQPRAAETNAAKILTEAYALQEGQSLSYDATLTGKITTIDTPYSSSYKNISVIIEVPGHADKPMLCYRLKGDGADKLAVGDTITVTGKIKNYYGKIEFDAGCTLDKVVPGGGAAAVAPSDPKKIVDEAFALEAGASLPYSSTLTGKIVTVNTPYDASYKNITVTIEVEGTSGKKNIECYRLKGEGAEALKVGDVIVVEGIIKRYVKTDAETGEVTQDKIEFNAPNLIEVNPSTGGNEAVAPSDPKQIVDAAFALEGGKSLPYTAKLTGKIVTVDTPYSDQYKNITVTIEVEGTSGKKNIECFRLKGEGVDALKVGDTITVEGNIQRYIKTDEATGAVITDKVEFNMPTLVSVVSGNEGGNNDQGNNNQGNNNQGNNNQGNNNQGNNNQGGTTQKTPAQIVAEAFALKSGESLTYEATLTGKITSVDYAYSATSGDITVSISVEGKTLKCYRMTGGGIDQIKVGDTITVKGKIKNYNGTIEFDRPVLTAVNNGANTSPGTADYSMTGLIFVMAMATTALVVLTKKKFYC